MLLSPLLYLSAFFEVTREEYYRQLYNVSAKGSWQEWLEYFLNGVATASLSVLSRAERINNLISDWQIKVGGTSSTTLPEIVKYLAANPFLTVKRLSENLNIAYTTAQRAINKLEDLKIISKTSSRARDRVYCATKILEIIDEPTMANEEF